MQSGHVLRSMHQKHMCCKRVQVVAMQIAVEATYLERPTAWLPPLAIPYVETLTVESVARDNVILSLV